MDRGGLAYGGETGGRWSTTPTICLLKSLVIAAGDKTQMKSEMLNWKELSAQEKQGW